MAASNFKNIRRKDLQFRVRFQFLETRFRVFDAAGDSGFQSVTIVSSLLRRRISLRSATAFERNTFVLVRP
jgi:hypothetical protein